MRTFVSNEPLAMSLESGEKAAFKTRLDEKIVLVTLGTVGAAAAKNAIALRRRSRTIVSLDRVEGAWTSLPWRIRSLQSP